MSKVWLVTGSSRGLRCTVTDAALVASDHVVASVFKPTWRGAARLWQRTLPTTRDVIKVMTTPRSGEPCRRIPAHTPQRQLVEQRRGTEGRPRRRSADAARGIAGPDDMSIRLRLGSDA